MSTIDSQPHLVSTMLLCLQRTRTTPRLSHVCVLVWVLCLVASCEIAVASEPEKATATATEEVTIDSLPTEWKQLSEQYCSDCHTGSGAEARLDFAAWSEQPTANHFAEWRRASQALVEQTMPPMDAFPLPDEDRKRMRDYLELALRQSLVAHGDDPGPTLVRRLTSAEYDYCIEDLTGLRLQLGERFVSDSVGGSGFTNSASAQFLQDATLQRYLEAARHVADHAMIGAGPITFFESPGDTGLELSAARRIQELYRQYGFRSAAGEGAKPFGLERFATAFHVAWQYRYRNELGMQSATLEELARDVQLEGKFAAHVWQVFERTDAPFPLSDIIQRWSAFPSPREIAAIGASPNSPFKEGDHSAIDQKIAQLSLELFQQMQRWQTRFAGSASAEEEAAVLAGGHIEVPSQASFVARALRKRKVRSDQFTPDLNNARVFSEDGRVRFKLSVEPASEQQENQPAVIFSHPKFRFRVTDVVQPDALPLRTVLAEAAVESLRFGQNPGGEMLAEDEFSLRVGESLILEFELPADCRLGELMLDARLDSILGRDSVVRCIVDDVTSERGRSFSSLLRDPHSQSMDAWEAGLAQFASALPQISHREPIPSDRDPIPAPYDNTYNLPERNFFHTAVKYHRDDQFLYDYLISDDVAQQLNWAWADLLTSFDYHDVNARFVCDKFGIELEPGWSLSSDAPWLEGIDDRPRQFLVRFLSEKKSLQAVRQRAEPEHLQNVLDFASRAWRRPLLASDAESLTKFYHQQRADFGLAHAPAIRACLTRILVSPDFLFRIEHETEQEAESKGIALSSLELASRLSFSLWSSIPDKELRELAERDALRDEHVLEAQVRRMLAAPQSRRLATEFFGQWLGFYQFDRFRGVDAGRFPEFDEALKKSLYDEAINLCAHIIQADLPYQSVTTADMTFVDQRAAEHYAMKWDSSWTAPKQITGTHKLHRSGVLGLGAILTSTSAPLRTSPVKRGDWILRRILGTPVPPPPADAGSIAAEEVMADGQTVRQRLEVHRQQAACMSCHQRIDPLGFTLENFDSLGRWRETYADGQAIDASDRLPSGQPISGVDGLLAHLTQSDDLVRRTFATKLVAYCLGRAETVADAALVERIMEQWQEDPRVSTAIITIAKSPQFTQRRSSNRPTDIVAVGAVDSDAADVDKKNSNHRAPSRHTSIFEIQGDPRNELRHE